MGPGHQPGGGPPTPTARLARDQPLAAAAIGASGIEAGSPVQCQGLALAAEALSLPPSACS
jgi:hypothetical protein